MLSNRFVILLPFICQGCTIVVLGLAKADDDGRAHFDAVFTTHHEEWLIHSTAVGAAIFLSIIVTTYLLGDTQPLKTVIAIS